MSDQITKVKKYVQLVESFDLNTVSASELLHPNYQQHEFPNLLNRNGQKSDLAETFKRQQLAKKLLSSQKFEISMAIENKNIVVIEAIWEGVIAVDVGPLKANQCMKAFFCMIFEFMDGKILNVRNYDCFETE